MTSASAPAVAVDARMIGMGGIGRYAESLLKEMLRQRPRTVRWILVGDPERLTRITTAAPGVSAEIRVCHARIYSGEEAFGMKRHFEGADLVHVPHFNAPLFGVHAKLVVTLHDLIHFDYPAYQPFPGANLLLDWKLRRLLRRADGVLTVSQATADALRKRYPASGLEKKCRVIWEGAEKIFDPAPRPDDAVRLERMGIRADKPYVLYVGAIREHKQTHVLIDAFRRMEAEEPGGTQLVLAGSLDWRYDRKQNLSTQFHGSSGIRYIPSGSDEDLAALYRHAAVFVLPSATEGFGLPVVEAMQSGTPVVVSDIPSLIEIGGSAVRTFPAGNPDALKNVLTGILRNPETRFRLSAQSLDRARTPKLFDWSHTAAQTLEFYDQILRGR